MAVEIRTVPAELDGQTLVLGIARDITERKRMEEKFREAEEQYRTLIENATDAIVVAQNGHIVYRNPADLKLLGYTDEELAAQDFLAWVVPEDRARIRRYQQQRLQGKPTPSQYEITVITRDGRRIPVELKPRVIQYRGQPATLVMMRDMTARKHAQEALQKAHDES